MEKVRILEIKESVFADNDRQADQLRARLKEKGVFLMNLMSSPGSGKTTTLKKTIETLKNDFRIGVMEADIGRTCDCRNRCKSNPVTYRRHVSSGCKNDRAGDRRIGH